MARNRKKIGVRIVCIILVALTILSVCSYLFVGLS